MLIIAYIRQRRGDNNSRGCDIHMSDDNDYNKKQEQLHAQTLKLTTQKKTLEKKLKNIHY